MKLNFKFMENRIELNKKHNVPANFDLKYIYSNQI